MSDKITYIYTIEQLKEIIISSSAVLHYGTKWVAQKKLEKVEALLRKNKYEDIPNLYKQRLKPESLIECVSLIFRHQELVGSDVPVRLDKNHGEITMDLSLKVMTDALHKSVALLENRDYTKTINRNKIRRRIRAIGRFGPK